MAASYSVISAGTPCVLWVTKIYSGIRLHIKTAPLYLSHSHCNDKAFTTVVIFSGCQTALNISPDIVYLRIYLALFKFNWFLKVPRLVTFTQTVIYWWQRVHLRWCVIAGSKYFNHTEAWQLTFQHRARIPPSNGIPKLNKENESQKQIDNEGHKKHQSVKVTIEAQLPQCLQVYVFFT